ncbi:alanine:cation symporter family protein, partial [Brevibacillus sp. SIMBA_076]
ASIAAFGIGNGVQTNSVALALKTTFDVPLYISGILIMIFTGAVILGGVRSIGKVVSYFVPVMIVFYLGSGLLIMFMN